MARSPFEIAFDHMDECQECDLGMQRLCPDGRALFTAAHEACKRLAGMDLTSPRAKA
jgi:hypothetical protein